MRRKRKPGQRTGKDDGQPLYRRLSRPNSDDVADSAEEYESRFVKALQLVRSESRSDRIDGMRALQRQGGGPSHMELQAALRARAEAYLNNAGHFNALDDLDRGIARSSRWLAFYLGPILVGIGLFTVPNDGMVVAGGVVLSFVFGAQYAYYAAKLGRRAQEALPRCHVFSEAASAGATSAITVICDYLLERNPRGADAQRALTVLLPNLQPEEIAELGRWVTQSIVRATTTTSNDRFRRCALDVLVQSGDMQDLQELERWLMLHPEAPKSCHERVARLRGRLQNAQRTGQLLRPSQPPDQERLLRAARNIGGGCPELLLRTPDDESAPTSEAHPHDG